jgi:hypothetical protein
MVEVVVAVVVALMVVVRGVVVLMVAVRVACFLLAALFALSGPARLVASHQRIQETCNA